MGANLRARFCNVIIRNVLVITLVAASAVFAGDRADPGLPQAGFTTNPCGVGKPCVWLNIQSYGAKGDGVTDDAAAFQAAADALPASGGAIYLPPTAANIYQFGTTRVNIGAPIAISCASTATTLRWNVTTLSDPGGTDRGVLNIRGTDSAYLPFVRIAHCGFAFGATRTSPYAEGRRGINIYNADNIYITGNEFDGSVGEMVGLGNFCRAPVRLCGPANPGTTASITGNVFSNQVQDALNPNVFDAVIKGNRFLTGTTAIEAGRNGVTITNNEVYDSLSQFVKLSGVDGFLIAGNHCIDCLDQRSIANQQGMINVADTGAGVPSRNGTIANNIFALSSTGTFNNQTAIFIADTSGPAVNVLVDGNNIVGIQTGIEGVTLTKSIIQNNFIHTTANGIVLAANPTCTFNRVVHNVVLDASHVDIEDQNGPANGNVIADNTTTAVASVAGLISRGPIDGQTSQFP